MKKHPTLLRLKTALWTASVLLSALLIWCVGAYGQSAQRIKEISNLMSTLYERGQFNGVILVAEQGNVVYSNAFGKANFQTSTNFTLDTPSNIGSLTKQFTAMTIMILAERSKLNYDELVSKYIPEFSRSPHLTKITLRHLLTHTSGIRDYGDLGIDDSGLTEERLIAAILEKEELHSEPGQKYRYSNPGYALLAIVVHRVSGKPFGDFLDQEIFKPLGMSNTFVDDGPRKRKMIATVGYDQTTSLDK